MPNADGSASIWVGNVDAVFGSSWRVELRLRPGRAVLEQHTTLFNGGDARHRYYWWTNAAVEVGDDSELVYPTHLMATHGFTAIEPWPIDAQRQGSADHPQPDRRPGVALHLQDPRAVHRRLASGDANRHRAGGLSRRAADDQGLVVGIRQATRTPGAKRSSDDRSAYIELQSGLFRNQETYAFLGPQERVAFSEYWVPVRDMDGVTRATVGRHLSCDAQRQACHVRAELDACDRRRSRHGSAGRQGAARHDWRGCSLAEVWKRQLTGVTARFRRGPSISATRHGTVLLHHDEGRYDALTPEDIKPGPQEAHRLLRPIGAATATSLELGRNAELNGRRLEALEIYRAGLARFADSASLNKAAGRSGDLAALARGEGVDRSDADDVNQAIEWLERAYRRDTTDMETRYYLGLARAAVGDHREAREHLEAAQRFALTSAPARLQLARLAAREGRWTEALSRIEALVADRRRQHAGGSARGRAAPLNSQTVASA